MNTLIQSKIENMVNSLLPNGAGSITSARLIRALETIAQKSYTWGENDALVSLMDIDQALVEINQRIEPRKISKRRLQAIAAARHERFGVGALIGGVWLFRPSEIDGLIPGDVGHPKNAR